MISKQFKNYKSLQTTVFYNFTSIINNVGRSLFWLDLVLGRM